MKRLFICLLLLLSVALFVGCSVDKHTHDLKQIIDENGHYLKCECGYVESSEEHNYILNNDRKYHYYECECGNIISKEEHTFKIENDEKYHWNACECGYITKHEEHSEIWIVDKKPTIEKVGWILNA